MNEREREENTKQEERKKKRQLENVMHDNKRKTKEEYFFFFYKREKTDVSFPVSFSNKIYYPPRNANRVPFPSDQPVYCSLSLLCLLKSA